MTLPVSPDKLALQRQQWIERQKELATPATPESMAAEGWGVDDIIAKLKVSREIAKAAVFGRAK